MSGRITSQFAIGSGRADWLLILFTSVLIAIVGASVLVVDGKPLKAQAKAAKVAVAVAAPAAPVVSQKALDRGFSIHFDDRLSDSLAKFDEHVQTHAWDKAFRILADIPEDKWTSMLPDAHGFIRPASQRVGDAILALSADGREAYRLFFDAKARLLFESIRTAQKEEDVQIARSVYDRYFITSVGDDAADRLADDYFERGQFVDAARYWKSIFDFHPDTNLSESKLLVKRAAALLLAGQQDEYHSVRGQLDRDFPKVKVVFGGREAVAAEYLNTLETEAKASLGSKAVLPSVGEQQSFSGLAPAEDTQPSWHFRFLEENDWAAILASVRNYYGVAALSAIVPAAATDGKRVFCNWMGTCFAVDVESGKTSWTSSSLKSVVNQLKMNNGRPVFYAAGVAQYSLAVGNGVVLSVGVPPGQNGGFRLTAYDATTGKELWKSSQRSTAGFSQDSFIGTPLIVGDAVYTLSHKGTNDSNNMARRQRGNATANELVLRYLDLHTGNELWSLPLGTPQLVGNADWGTQSLPIPALVLSGRRLYVLTNDGALAAINIGRRQIEWIFKYDPSPSSGNAQRFWNGNAIERHAHGPCPILVRDGVIYFKEHANPTLYAVAEEGPRVLWKWQESEYANLVGVDDHDLYLFSDELTAITRKKPEFRWSNKLPVDLQGLGARVGEQAVLVFTGRGLFELSKENGDTQHIFRGADLGAGGGVILSAGNRLVCVSNVAVTAYPAPTGH